MAGGYLSTSLGWLQARLTQSSLWILSQQKHRGWRRSLWSDRLLVRSPGIQHGNLISLQITHIPRHSTPLRPCSWLTDGAEAWGLINIWDVAQLWCIQGLEAEENIWIKTMDLPHFLLLLCALHLSCKYCLLCCAAVFFWRCPEIIPWFVHLQPFLCVTLCLGVKFSTVLNCLVNLFSHFTDFFCFLAHVALL